MFSSMRRLTQSTMHVNATYLSLLQIFTEDIPRFQILFGLLGGYPSTKRRSLPLGQSIFMSYRAWGSSVTLDLKATHMHLLQTPVNCAYDCLLSLLSEGAGSGKNLSKEEASPKPLLSHGWGMV